MVGKEGENSLIPYAKEERTSPKLKNLLRNYKRGELDNSLLNPEIIEEINKFLSTDSSMVETMSGYAIIHWMKSQKMLGSDKAAHKEMKTFSERQMGRRGIVRRRRR